MRSKGHTCRRFSDLFVQFSSRGPGLTTFLGHSTLIDASPQLSHQLHPPVGGNPTPSSEERGTTIKNLRPRPPYRLEMTEKSRHISPAQCVCPCERPHGRHRVLLSHAPLDEQLGPSAVVSRHPGWFKYPPTSVPMKNEEASDGQTVTT